MWIAAILRNEVSWFDQNNSTLLSSRLATDASLVRTTLVDRVITLFQNLGLLVTALIITFNLQWKIALVMMATLPALVFSNLGQVNDVSSRILILKYQFNSRLFVFHEGLTQSKIDLIQAFVLDSIYD